MPGRDRWRLPPRGLCACDPHPRAATLPALLGAHTPAGLEGRAKAPFSTFARHRQPGVFYGFISSDSHAPEKVSVSVPLLPFYNLEELSQRRRRRAERGLCLPSAGPAAGASVEPRRVGGREDVVWGGSARLACPRFPRRLGAFGQTPQTRLLRHSPRPDAGSSARLLYLHLVFLVLKSNIYVF